MTVIVAAKDRVGIWHLACDFALTFNGRSIKGPSKLLKTHLPDIGPVVYGVGGNASAVGLLLSPEFEDELVKAAPRNGRDVAKVMQQAVVRAARDGLYAQDPGNVDFKALLVVSNFLFEVTSDECTPVMEKQAAIGTGADVALGYVAGYLEQCLRIHTSTIKAVELAIQFTCERVSGCALFGDAPAQLSSD